MTKTFTKIGATTYDNEDWMPPYDRTFRDAWQATGPDTGIIDVDMEKAKEIWRDKIRARREEPLAALDTEYMRAMEAGADTAGIVAQKQALRDAPADPAIDAATTPEELKLVQPIAGVIVE